MQAISFPVEYGSGWILFPALHRYEFHFVKLPLIVGILIVISPPHTVHLGLGWEIVIVSALGEQTLLTALLTRLSINSLPICIISTYSSCCSTDENPYSTAVVIIAVSTVAICTRKQHNQRSIELDDDTRSDKHWPTSISNKRRRRRKKSRKKKTRDPDVTIDLESEEIEEVESFEEEIPPLKMNGAGTKGVSGSGQ
jgi:hypothetical protein